VGFLVAIHEFGHFIMAKRAKVRVEIFSIGFGPAIFKFKRPNDDTEYRIAWIPLGGYVKLSGELPTEDHKPEPHELWAKTPWQKFTIFVAGVVMNFLVAVPLCILVPIVGRNVMAPYLGSVDGPEKKAGLKPGDKILEVDGNKVVSIDDYRLEILDQWAGEQVEVKVERDGEVKTFTVIAGGSESHQVLPTINMVHKVNPDAKAGFQKGDVITAITAPDVRKEIYNAREDYVKSLDKFAGLPATFHVRRDGKMIELQVTMPKRTLLEFPRDENLIEAIASDVAPNSAAHKAGLQKGDKIIQIDNEPIESWRKMKSIIEKSGDKKLSVKVKRGGNVLVYDITPVNGKLGIIGSREGQREGTDTVAFVEPGSFWEKAGLKTGDRLLRVGSVQGEVRVGHLFKEESWTHTAKSEKDKEGVPKKLPVVLIRDGQTVNLDLEPNAQIIADDSVLGIELGVNQVEFKLPLGEAIVYGFKEPLRIIKLTYRLLAKLFSGDESMKNMAGPLGIAHISYHSLQEGVGKFIWLLALISVNLGVINLLPLPLLDGGHMWILLMYEKIKGRPPSQKFLILFQYAGLAFFLMMVIFVTFQDIKRIF
jgi:regulator of sigma E protease